MMKSITAFQTRMTSGSEGISNYVRRLLTEKGLSPADVELRACGKISDSRIAGLSVGDCENLRWDTLCALAKGLGIAEERLFAVATGSHLQDYRESDFLVLYEKYRDLPDDEKQELDGLLALLHREIERLHRCHPDSVRRSSQPTADDVFRWQHKLFSLPQGKRLKNYVCQILRENQLTLKDVEERSKQKISVSYLRNITLDGTKNLTIAKIKALADGLSVNLEEIFAVLEAQPPAERGEFKHSIFAVLHYQYKSLESKGKEELRLLLKLVDCEIDKRQMQQLRLAEKRKATALEVSTHRKAS